MHLEIYKLAISFREEFMASKNFIGEKFMISCKNIHPCDSSLLQDLEPELGIYSAIPADTRWEIKDENSATAFVYNFFKLAGPKITTCCGSLRFMGL